MKFLPVRAPAYDLLIYHLFANDNTRSHSTWDPRKAKCDPPTSNAHTSLGKRIDTSLATTVGQLSYAREQVFR